jgi:hypothetical protein
VVEVVVISAKVIMDAVPLHWHRIMQRLMLKLMLGLMVELLKAVARALEL